MDTVKRRGFLGLLAGLMALPKAVFAHRSQPQARYTPCGPDGAYYEHQHFTPDDFTVVVRESKATGEVTRFVYNNSPVLWRPLYFLRDGNELMAALPPSGHPGWEVVFGGACYGLDLDAPWCSICRDRRLNSPVGRFR